MLNQGNNRFSIIPFSEAGMQEELFRVKAMGPITIQPSDTLDKLSIALLKVKAELDAHKRNLLIEQVKNAVIEIVYYSEKDVKINFAEYLSRTFDYHYAYLAALFHRVQGYTIQEFINITKVERVKELLVYESASLEDISQRLHYKSVTHLARQFKKITGLTPAKFLTSVSKHNMAS